MDAGETGAAPSGWAAAATLLVIVLTVAVAGGAWRVRAQQRAEEREQKEALLQGKGRDLRVPRTNTAPLRVVIEAPIADSPDVRDLYQNAGAPLPREVEVRGLATFFVGAGCGDDEAEAAANRQRQRVVEAYRRFGFVVVRRGVAEAQAEAARCELEDAIFSEDHPDLESVYFEAGLRAAAEEQQLPVQPPPDPAKVPLSPGGGGGSGDGGGGVAPAPPAARVGNDGSLGTTLRGDEFNLAQLPPELRRRFVRKVMGFCHDGYPRLQHLAKTCAVVAQALTGAPVRLMQDMAMVKPPGGREKPWHQDAAFFKYPLGAPIVGAWVALSDVTRDNGCMCVLLPPPPPPPPPSTLRGSSSCMSARDAVEEAEEGEEAGEAAAEGGEQQQQQQQQQQQEEEVVPQRVFPHFQRRDWQICDADVRARQARAAAVTMKPGDIMFFSALLPHGTQVNASHTQRWAVQLHFVGEGCEEGTDAQRLAVFGADEVDGGATGC